MSNECIVLTNVIGQELYSFLKDLMICLCDFTKDVYCKVDEHSDVIEKWYGIVKTYQQDGSPEDLGEAVYEELSKTTDEDLRKYGVSIYKVLLASSILGE